MSRKTVAAEEKNRKGRDRSAGQTKKVGLLGGERGGETS